MLSVMCMDWIHYWNYHTAHLVSSSTALALSDKRKSISSSAKPVKDNQYWREIRCNKHTWKKVNELVTCRYVTLTHCNIHSIHDESAKCCDNMECYLSEMECLCSKTTTVLTTIPKTMEVSLLHFYCIRNK